MEAVVKFDGAVAVVLEKLVGMGYFKTRSEAFRAGVLGLGEKYCLMDPKEIEDALAAWKMQQVSREIDEGKRKEYPLDEVLKEAKRRAK